MAYLAGGIKATLSSFVGSPAEQRESLLSPPIEDDEVDILFDPAFHNSVDQAVFCHLDVNMYEATRKSLEYLAPRMANRSLIVVDDYGHRNTPGVARAVDDFVAEDHEFVAVPMFPCQVLLFPKKHW